MAAPVEAVPGAQVLLGRELRGAVGRERPALVVLARRAVALAVDRAAGGAEDELRTVRAGGLEDVQRSEHVHLGVEDGLRDRGSDVRLRRQVDDELGPDLVEQAVEGLADVVLVHRRGGDVLAAPGGEVVDDVDLVAALDQRIDDVRPDESRSPGDDGPHRRILEGRCSSPSREWTAPARRRRWSGCGRPSRRRAARS